MYNSIYIYIYININININIVLLNYMRSTEVPKIATKVQAHTFEYGNRFLHVNRESTLRPSFLHVPNGHEQYASGIALLHWYLRL